MIKRGVRTLERLRGGRTRAAADQIPTGALRVTDPEEPSSRSGSPGARSGAARLSRSGSDRAAIKLFFFLPYISTSPGRQT